MQMRQIIETLFPPAPGPPPIPQPAEGQPSSIAEVLEQFRNDRAEDIAKLADRAGRSGERVAEAERERDQWRRYARELEKICMGSGCTLPTAPGEE